jgi:hypothetical protein
MAAMTEEKGFLERWSKRKRAVRAAEALPEPAPDAAPTAEPVAATATEPEIEPEIDPATLPPIESIRTGADIQAFLQRGVPKALRQAALRRLWSADPAIREFREVADYDWDFNAPGYGALLPKDDPKAVVEKLFAAMRRRVAAPQAAVVEPAVAEPEMVEPAVAEPEPPRSGEASSAAVANSPAAPPAGRRRRHGAATPS